MRLTVQSKLSGVSAVLTQSRWHCSHPIQDIREAIAAFLARCYATYQIVPFDDVLYQECVGEAARRGYVMDDTPSVRTYLREAVTYATTACGHLTHRPTQIWSALYLACVFFVDDAMMRFPLEITNIYRFNQRFVWAQAQGNGILDALADLLHQVPDLFQPVPSNLVVTSTLDFVTGNLLEHETESIQISGVAQRYATYQRSIAAGPGAFAFMAFAGVPMKDYVQALPEIMLFFANTNDILSVYKEELAGETTNQVSILAARAGTSKSDVLKELVETTAKIFETVLEILHESPVVCETFKKFATGLILFHTSVERYKLADLELSDHGAAVPAINKDTV